MEKHITKTRITPMTTEELQSLRAFLMANRYTDHDGMADAIRRHLRGQRRYFGPANGDGPRTLPEMPGLVTFSLFGVTATGQDGRTAAAKWRQRAMAALRGHRVVAA